MTYLDQILNLKKRNRELRHKIREMREQAEIDRKEMKKAVLKAVKEKFEKMNDKYKFNQYGVKLGDVEKIIKEIQRCNITLKSKWKTKRFVEYYQCQGDKV